MTIHIAITYHSGFGHTARVAEAIATGAKQLAQGVALIKAASVSEEEWKILDASHAIIFGAPTYMGGISGPFKSFLDSTSSRWVKRAWKDKIASGFTNSGSLSGDKLLSLQQLFITAMQHGMIWVGQTQLGPSPKGKEVASSHEINRLGSYSGLMTQSNQESPDLVPPSGDLETALEFGKRIAEITALFNK